MSPSAWDRASEAAGRAGVEIRSLASLEDADGLLDILLETWGPGSALPRELIRALQASGTPPIGAFRDGRLIGYVLGFLGVDGEGVHVHSHMLAVAPQDRSAGVGLALKLAQRAAALDFGVRIARWTFDPLVARNAHFNLVKLRAIADRFHRHLYGDMEDRLNRGDRSDRLEARWELDREPAGQPVKGPGVVVLARRGDDDLPRPGEVRPPDPAGVLVEIPRDYVSLRGRDPGLASAWRDATARALEACLDAGLVATSFLEEGAYVFTQGGHR